MTDSIEQIERLKRRIAELRAGLGRVEQRRLEAGDWAEICAMFAEAIAEAESGQQGVSVELAEQEDGSGALPSGEESTS